MKSIPLSESEIQVIRRTIQYDPLTGEFRREGNPFAPKQVIRIATPSGPRNVMATRVAWFLHYGEEPQRTLVQLNGDPKDFRLANIAERNGEIGLTAALEKGRGAMIEIRPIDLQVLREEFEYSPETGIVRRKLTQSTGTRHDKGYLVFNMGKRRVYAHRIAHALHHGFVSKFIIDHADGERSNNRPENLREATQAENIRNRKVAKNNTSGYSGVSFVNGMWRAQITVNRHVITLGAFREKADAVDARRAAEVKYFGEFAYTNDG